MGMRARLVWRGFLLDGVQREKYLEEAPVELVKQVLSIANSSTTKCHPNRSANNAAHVPQRRPNLNPTPDYTYI